MVSNKRSVEVEEPRRAELAKRVIREHPWGAFGTVIGIVTGAYDLLVKKELTVASMIVMFLAILFYLIDVARDNAKSYGRISERIDHLATDKIDKFEAAIENNSRVLKAHELLLISRTTDRLTLIGFKNLLAYLPFYLAEDLGYLQEEHIAIASFVPSLDDQSTATQLLQNPKAASRFAIHICVSQTVACE
jgi:hypothetical protein